MQSLSSIKVNAALRLLDKSSSTGVLQLTHENIKELKSKHPPPADLNEDVMIKGEVPFADPILFENIDDETILKAALRTKGAAGPSGLDADGWRRILVSKNYGTCGNDLR